MTNLLTQPLITVLPLRKLNLPGVLAALVRDEVNSFAALRPHQGMFWHMFLVQVASLALHRAGRSDLPGDEDGWRDVLRGLTPEYPDDEPWCLVVEDKGKPAFMQPAVPSGVALGRAVPTPDALDLLITARNHDLKQAVASVAEPEDWLFALIALQTGEGYGGAGNHGIARMNGGSSSRPMVALAPLDAGSSTMMPRLGAWFARDVRVLLDTRKVPSQIIKLDFPFAGGLGLSWLAPWPEGAQLRIGEMDRWFIEVCRRVRLHGSADGRIAASRGTSKAARMATKELKGGLDDPWAPFHKTEEKGFTLAGRDFTYRTITDLVLSDDWILPVLAQVQESDQSGSQYALVLQALARGNAKTEGFKSRVLPLSERVTLAVRAADPTLPALAREQVEIIASIEKSLKSALALIAAGGEREKRKKEHYAFADSAGTTLSEFADEIFFPMLWRRFQAADEAGGEAVKGDFIRQLRRRALEIFDVSAPTMPCSSLLRPKAQVRARAALLSSIKRDYESYLDAPAREVSANAA